MTVIPWRRGPFAFALALFLVLLPLRDAFNQVVALPPAADKAWRTSRSRSSSATTSCRTGERGPGSHGFSSGAGGGHPQRPLVAPRPSAGTGAASTGPAPRAHPPRRWRPYPTSRRENVLDLQERIAARGDDRRPPDSTTLVYRTTRRSARCGRRARGLFRWRPAGVLDEAGGPRAPTYPSSALSPPASEAGGIGPRTRFPHVAETGRGGRDDESLRRSRS